MAPPDDLQDEPPLRAGTGTVRAVDRAMQLLLAFAGKPPQKLADLARAADLDKGTARRLLLTLMGTGFVVQDSETQRYGLGNAVRVLSSSIVEAFSLRAIARPVLTSLAAELQVTSFLSVYRDHAAVCLDRFHDMRGMELHWWPVGGTMPLNCGGAPKLLLALQPPDEIARALATDLTPLTPTAGDHSRSALGMGGGRRFAGPDGRRRAGDECDRRRAVLRQRNRADGAVAGAQPCGEFGPSAPRRRPDSPSDSRSRAGLAASI
jgi:DNA-binding IclR family transcriptional regulator